MKNIYGQFKKLFIETLNSLADWVDNLTRRLLVAGCNHEYDIAYTGRRHFIFCKKGCGYYDEFGEEEK